MNDSAEKMTAVRRNIFLDAHRAIPEGQRFPWHRNSTGVIDSDVPHSSQALCLSVFGSIAAYPDRGPILRALLRAASLDVPISDKVEMKPELEDPKLLNELGTPNATNLDYLIDDDASVIALESKFLERAFSPCSQPPEYCSGNFEVGSNRKTNSVSPCRLMVPDGKRTPRRYWELASDYFRPEVLTPPQRPCVFKDDAYQLMRNFLTAAALAKTRGSPAFGMVVIFVERSPFSAHLDDSLSSFRGLLQGQFRGKVGKVPYERITGILRLHGRTDLADFIEAKIEEGLRSGQDYIRGGY